MTITVDLTPEVEAKLRAQARGLALEEYVGRVLQGLAASHGPRHRKTPAEFAAFLDAFAAHSDEIPSSPGETFSREMIYEDHD